MCYGQIDVTVTAFKGIVIIFILIHLLGFVRLILCFDMP